MAHENFGITALLNIIGFQEGGLAAVETKIIVGEAGMVGHRLGGGCDRIKLTQLSFS